jgi:hypothetical protein
MPPNKEQRERLQSWFDLGEVLYEHGPDLIQRVYDSRSALKGYIEGRFEAHYHVGIRTGRFSENSRKFCARLKANRRGPRPIEGSRLEAGNCEVPSPRQLHLKLTHISGVDRLDFSVFVPADEFVEHHERVKVFDGTPPVRLVRLDDCPVHGPDAGQSSISLPVEVPPVATDDELRGGRTFAVGLSPPYRRGRAPSNRGRHGSL